ncbi:hypothetical protein [Hymenobacter sp.]|uniref:RCC1 domain-containing protein n=1 Tax=Hymenobacter sp. TaxID=1898978 RepID=UPI00286D416D|nr:hypothetical protein [Hymenobacter sp.]
MSQHLRLHGLLWLLPLAGLRAQTTSLYTQVAAGESHSLALRADGTLWAWGANNYSQLGNGNTTGRSLPAPVAAPVAAAPGTRWTSIASRSSHALAGRSDGTLWAWGYNDYGNLGDGTLTTRVSPVLVPVPAGAAVGTTWGQVATNYHTLALRSDGTLWAWGLNNVGQLGDASTAARLAAVAVPTPAAAAAGTTWTKVDVGRDHSLALRSDGTLWAWGGNAYGQLANGTPAGLATPRAVVTPAGAAAGTTWTDFAAGYYFSLGLRSDGTLWAWGYNPYGQLGDASTTSSLVPVAVVTPGTVGAGTRWTRVAAGNDHALALRSDGSLWAWGYNNYDQLGIQLSNGGTPPSSSTPVRETTNGTWSAVAGGYYTTLALQAATTLVYGTGYNRSGQLGTGNITNSPVFVASAAPLLATRPARVPLVGVHPNPARAQCRLPALPPGSTVRLTDLRGSLVRQQAAAPTLSLTGLAPGLYLLTAQAPGQAPRVARLAVE